MQINPTTYCIYGNKEKQTQTFPYCNYGSKKKMNPHKPPIVFMTTPKKWIAIEFFLF
jgi:hypothetical protein